MKRFAAAVLTTLFLAQPSCDSEDTKTYDATIQWRVNNSKVCAALAGDDHGGGQIDISEVAITVWNSEDDVETDKDPVVEETDINCTKYEATLDSLSRGKYFVVVEGKADFDGETLPYFKGSAEIIVPTEESTLINLELSTGSVQVTWGFEDRRMCNANGVVTVEAVLESDSTTRKSGSVDCNDGAFLFEDLPWEFFTLEIEAFDADGKVTYEGSYISDASEEGDAGTDAGSADLNLIDVRPGKYFEAFVELSEN